VFSAHGDDVTFTMVDGEVLMDEHGVRVADADAIRRRAREIDVPTG
jgi:cytosine/adenosine deaminase-related metal-dependent hydrolase